MRGRLHVQARSVWLGLVCAALVGGCATPVELAPEEGYLLSRVGYSAGFPLAGLEFRNVDTGEDVLVRPGRAILTRAAPGRYYMRRVRSAYDNVYGLPFEQPPALIAVEAGKINYIGSWGILVAGETSNRIMLAPRHDYPKEVIDEGKAASGALFSLYSVVEARPRFVGDPDVGAEPK